MKLQVADVFLEKFQLKPDEVKALRGNRDGSLSQVRQQAQSVAKNFLKLSVCVTHCISVFQVVHLMFKPFVQKKIKL